MSKNLDTILISIDHETLGTDPLNSIMLSTGIVIGNTTGKISFKKEYIYPFIEQLKEAYTICAATIKWWCETPEKFELYKYYMGKCSKQTNDMSKIVHEIHNDLQSELSKLDLSINSPNTYLCAKPPKFDIAFLDRLFNDYLGALLPRASFRQDFDFRTIDKLCKNMPECEYIGDVQPHNALSDAEFQYNKLVHQLNKLNIKL